MVRLGVVTVYAGAGRSGTEALWEQAGMFQNAAGAGRNGITKAPLCKA